MDNSDVRIDADGAGKTAHDLWHGLTDNGEGVKASEIRMLAANGTNALRWLDQRLDPASRTARLELQIEAKI